MGNILNVRNAVWLLVLLVIAPVMAQPVSEYALKSALLFKLPQFVYRQEMDRSVPLSICVLGSNPFGSALERLAQNSLDGRAVRTVRLDGAREAAACDLVFISRSEAGGLDGILRRIGGFPVLTVSDIEGFARSGGMVELALGSEGTAINILINRRAAQRQGIEFNAQLLRLAKVVEP
ncbi:hypothetical protein MASR1M60_09110 [Rhodocyclaceae bacterium]